MNIKKIVLGAAFVLAVYVPAISQYVGKIDEKTGFINAQFGSDISSIKGAEESGTSFIRKATVGKSRVASYRLIASKSQHKLTIGEYHVEEVVYECLDGKIYSIGARMPIYEVATLNKIFSALKELYGNPTKVEALDNERNIFVWSGNKLECNIEHYRLVREVENFRPSGEKRLTYLYISYADISKRREAEAIKEKEYKASKNAKEEKLKKDL